MTGLHPQTLDLQSTVPDVALALGGVGVTGVRRALALGPHVRGMATIDVAVDLAADTKGVHMSRFHEAIAEAIDELGARAGGGEPGAAGPDVLAARIAALAVERQGASRASARVRAQLEVEQAAPASGRRSFEPLDATGHALVDAPSAHVRRMLEVSAVGINACPCAQELVRASSRERLLAAGLDDDTVAAALAAIPVATHNQLGTGTLVVGTEAMLDPVDLAAVVRASMSATVHELLKREDELHVVEQAHANPRFVEDCVREMVAGALAAGWPLAGNDLLWARQVNHESIHAHDVAAERGGRVGALRNELANGGKAPVAAAAHVTPASWLAGS